MRYRIIIEGEATDPPPDYAQSLHKIVEKEVRFMLGKAWHVVSTEELKRRTTVHSCTVPFRDLLAKGRTEVMAHLMTCPLPAEAHEGGRDWEWLERNRADGGSQVGRVSGLDPDA
jgi:hypothetical protein